MSKPLNWTYKSIFLILAVPLLVSPGLLQVSLAPTAFMFELALLIRVTDLVLAFVFALARVERRTPGPSNWWSFLLLVDA